MQTNQQHDGLDMDLLKSAFDSQMYGFDLY